jgi:hypothetical protein
MLRGAAFLVVEGPIAGALATVQGRQARVSVLDLGQGYELVSVALTLEREAMGELAVPEPDAVWAFDPDGRLVARHGK